MNLFYELISDDAGRRIKFERKQWGMSTRRLARLAYTDKETIESIEKGYVCMMDWQMLVNISKALQVSPFIFLSRTLTDEELMEIVLC